MIIPQKLLPNDVIGIIAPSYAVKPEEIEISLNTLEAKGFRVKLANNLFKDTFGYAASPQERADDFNAMIADDEVKMVFFGGGEVCNEILPYVDFEAIKKHPKIICSHSDSTTILNAVYTKTSLVTYYGSSLQTFSNLTDYNFNQFKSILMDGDIGYFDKNSKWETINKGKCEGTLIGGYLINFAVMLNGGFMPYDTSCKYIFFIEDHIQFSSPSVVSKYLSHIEQSGFFAHVSGLMFGHYSTEYYSEIEDILKRISAKYDIPVVKCDDFGHGENNAILPIGIKATLDATNQSLRFDHQTVINS
ncbi:MAG: hypothetical protein K0Q85_246 [Caproiciproducens sp.]|nr:hypothetical protein [Caproiciproducens sp.]